MLKLNSVIFLLLMPTFLLAETETQANVARLYLQYRFTSLSYSSATGFSIIVKPYYGYDANYIDTRVKYFGQNIAKEFEPVPDAKRLMNGYRWHGIGLIGCIVGGMAIVVATCVNEARNSAPKADGTYDASLPAGIPIGFGVIGAGFVLHWTKPIYLHFALKEFNKHAKN